MIANRIKIDVIDLVADVRMVRADKLNAIDPAMFDALIEAGDYLAGRDDVRAVVLSGEGRAFCAGLDMDVINALLAEGADEANALLKPSHGTANRAQQAVLAWRNLPVPVIAAVHGVAFGGGFQLMLGADLRYAAPDTRFSVMEIKWGLVPDMAGLPLMSALTRTDIIRDLTYSGREFLAEEALGYGLVTRLTDDPHGDAHQTARAIATKNPDAIRAAKRLMAKDIPDFDNRLLAEAREQLDLLGSTNQREAVAAALEKRPPLFR